MKFRWLLSPAQPLLAQHLSQELKIPGLLAQCLLNRGYSDSSTVRSFLEPRLKNLRDPFLLDGMAAAVERLFSARERKERLVIFGDYDVDGVASAAILLEVLRPLGWNVEVYLPHRLEEGYGLSMDAVEACLRKFNPNLLLAVDCGSSSPKSVAYLRECGVDALILDHHQVSMPLPEALAIVNPHAEQGRGGHQGGVEIGSVVSNRAAPTDHKELCSAGLSFKLAHALVKRGRETGLAGAAEYDLRPLLDLVALATIADVVPLTGENRILVSAGLQRLNTTQRLGLIALKKLAQSPAVIGAHEVSFQLAPRLNAAGRLESAEDALRLLLASSMAEAMPLAQRLDAQNRERQKIEREIAGEVIEAVKSKFQPENDFVIVEGKSPWHIGVVGIVASRVLQEFYRPTIIVGGGEGDQWRGSGRSIAGFDLAAGLRECGDLLLRHGGHAMAAGLTISAANLGSFRERLNEVARRNIPREHLEPSLQLDAETRLKEITMGSVRALERIRPAGQGNAPVRFCASHLVHQRPLQRVGGEKQHVKMWVTDGTSTHEAMWWRAGNESLPVGKFDLAFAPEINSYNGTFGVQLRVLDWRMADGNGMQNT